MTGPVRNALAEIVDAGRRQGRHLASSNRTSACPGPAIPRAMRIPEIYEAIKAHRMTLVFVNTRIQAEMLFQELWRYNDDESADRAASRLARCRPAAQGRGGDGGGQAPRRGLHLDARSRHRLGRCRSRHQCRRAERREPACPAHRPRQSPARRAVARRCSCRPTASRCSNARRRSRRPKQGAQDTPPSRPGALDVLAQHVLGMACAGPFDPDALYREVTSACALSGPDARGLRQGRASSSRPAAMRSRNYERYAKLKRDA